MGENNKYWTLKVKKPRGGTVVIYIAVLMMVVANLYIVITMTDDLIGKVIAAIGVSAISFLSVFFGTLIYVIDKRRSAVNSN